MLFRSNAYATIASGGIRHKPIAVKKIVFPDGKSEELGQARGRRTFSEGVAYEATKILQQNIWRGTGTSANIGCPVAGKTGTVDEYTDAWFVGYTPHLATSTWVGYPNSKISMPGMTGGSTPAAIWHDYMVQAIGGDCPEFEKPDKPAKFTAFFGTYARTGSRSDRNYSYRGSGYGSGSYNGGGGDGTTSGPGRGYDPRYYEAPPQRAPADSNPPSGGGGGGGGGRGGGGGDDGGDNGGGGGGNTGGTGGAAAPG